MNSECRNLLEFEGIDLVEMMTAKNKLSPYLAPLGTFKNVISETKYVTHFSLPAKDLKNASKSKLSFHGLVFEVLSNYGLEDFTCLYKIEVFGRYK